MKTLVIGVKSFLGRKFYFAYKKLYPDTIGTYHKINNEFIFFNLLNPLINKICLKDYSYALISAGITKISSCENQKEAYKINVEGLLSLLHELNRNNIIPIVFSSDYVFDGEKGEYTEEDLLSPINEYGRHKSILEKEIAKICGDDFLLFRLGKVFSLDRDGSLLDEIANKLANKETVFAAYDTVMTPIFIDDVVKAVIMMQKNNERGIYNLCGLEKWSRYDLALKICEEMGLNSELVKKISLEDLNESFRRPKRTDMRCDKLHKRISIGYNPLSMCIKKVVSNYE